MTDLSFPTAGVLLALDQGTSSTKALVVDPTSGAVLRRASVPAGIRFPSPGQVEQDLEDIWQATMAAALDVLADLPPSRIHGIVLSTQRESVGCWDDEGNPLGPLLGWQDARMARWCEEQSDHAELVRSRTGLPLDPMFSAPKMRHLLERHHRTDRPVHVGTVDAYLLLRLTGRHITEIGNASRTLLMDLRHGHWDAELLNIFGVAQDALPVILPSTGEFGTTRSGLPIPPGIPILAVMGDSHAALYLHSNGSPGVGKVTYGTGSSVMVLAESMTAPEGVSTTVPWATEHRIFAREGNILASGATLDWTAGLLTEGSVSRLEELAIRADQSGAAMLVPAFSGLGSPYFDRHAIGIIAGLSAGAGVPDLARAAFEAVAHQVTDVVQAIEADRAVSVGTIHADGGASVSRYLMQLQADLLARPIVVSSVAEASALGTALMAAKTLGLPDIEFGWTDARKSSETFHPRLGRAARAERRSRWRDSVARSRGIATEPSSVGTRTQSRRKGQ